MHALALELGWTVARLSAELSWGEFQDWIAFFKAREAERDKPPERDWASMAPEDVGALFGAVGR